MPASFRTRLAAAAVAIAATTVSALLLAETPSASQRADYRRPAATPFPTENAFSEARAALGKTLFFDPRLSGSNWISCASCHNPAMAWGDGLPRAIGHGMTELGRRTPTILNLAWSEALFWDGRANSLEEQALGPIQAPGEMNLPLDQLIAKLSAIPGYRSMFEQAYPGEAVAAMTIAKAIATFERTAVSARAPFDRWIDGDEAAISDTAKRGFTVFTGQGRCAQCHSGWRFTDDSFHDIGVVTSDKGRGELLAAIPVMQSAFKTPTLRNVTQRAPYMHNGSIASLDEAVELYDAGGHEHRASLSPEIRPLDLSAAQKRELLAFLDTLTSEDAPVVVPVLPR